MKNQTPRTDAYRAAKAAKSEDNWAAFARELERELEQERQDHTQADLDCLRALGERNTARLERDTARLERDTALHDLANERAYLDRVAAKMAVALNDWDDYVHTNETPAYQQARDELATISKFQKSTCVCGFCDGTDCNY